MKNKIDIPLLTNIAVKNGSYYKMIKQSLLQKWLRETHHIYIDIVSDYMLYKSNKNIVFDLTIKKNLIKCTEASPFETYEEALEYGIEESLKLITK